MLSKTKFFINTSSKACRVLLFLFLLAAMSILSVALNNASAQESERAKETENKRKSLQERTERDPTRPLVGGDDLNGNDTNSRVRIASLELELIRYRSRGTSSAVINGQPYMIGDRIGDWNVKQIEADRVVLIRDDEEIVLSVFSGQVRSSSKDNS